MQESDYVKVQETLESLNVKCPAFHHGCPFSNPHGRLTSDLVGQCPAFKEGCPFSGKNPEEIELLVKEIPKDHKLCPAFAPGENEKELSCMDGFSIIGFVKSIRNELFIEPLESGTQTLSNKMLEDTLDVHAEAERCIFIKHLIKGKISSDTYAKFLTCLYFIYSTMEEETIKFRTHPIVGLVHFPRQVNRIPSLLEDLEFFLGPNWKENAQPTKATKVYMDHIRNCARNAPHQLISHAFTRYLGDMFGGQVISRKLKRNFSLKDERGTAFYRFENITDLADFREFYLGRLNAIRVDDQMKGKHKLNIYRSFGNIYF
ncbi:hypothetical protein K502DRAFT_339456 [Neoconidiobolus thromboides FSU 785]|nr:hypothetical protein K502DRAFT_339456 [Neoconidiobolus thromboides FSU 785]